jgi:hypothetical protein
VPEILEISAPSSLANFLIFGLAELFPEAATLGAGCCCTWTTSFCFFSFTGSFLDFSFIGSFVSCFDSKVRIKSPLLILSPTETLIFSTLPSCVDGTSTLDLSLSKVIKESFFLI